MPTGNRPRRIVVLGTLAGNPYAGMAWMHMQITAGLCRLGHDVLYVEATSSWPYDPVRQSKVNDSEYAVAYLARVAAGFGLAERWAYRRSYSDHAWLGPCASRAAQALMDADLVLNVTGATPLSELGLAHGPLVYLGTDPILDEIAYERGDRIKRAHIDEHAAVVTFGENIGTPASPIPPLPRLRARTRQPVLLDLWAEDGRVAPPTRHCFTTVANWEQVGLDLEFRGERFRWSKHHEFLRVIDTPRRTKQALELASNLGGRRSAEGAINEDVPALGVGAAARELLEQNGWLLADGPALSTDPWRYRDYIAGSRAELTVARDMHVRLRSGWFSERSACYLAAGRPVVTQDTGFDTVLPTGEGLFAWRTQDEILAAIDAINADYARHSRAARAIAERYFRAETVLAKLLEDLGL